MTRETQTRICKGTDGPTKHCVVIGEECGHTLTQHIKGWLAHPKISDPLRLVKARHNLMKVRRLYCTIFFFIYAKNSFFVHDTHFMAFNTHVYSAYHMQAKTIFAVAYKWHEK